MRVFIGYDSREAEAFEVTERSMRRRCAEAIDVIPLRADELQARGLLWRPVDSRVGSYDLISNAPCATEFANTRFLVPILCQTGWALFIDCDMVVLDDISDLFGIADESKAVMVVKHDHRPAAGTKMDGRAQTHYRRKNWSSVMLINCDHPANRRLTIQDVNSRPGRDMHAFYWLADDEIGDLPARWNWLVNEQPKPDSVAIAHFTNGGPFTDGWPGAPFDEIWTEERNRSDRD